MPKKKIHHKGQPKHASEENEADVFGKSNGEETEEEYTTVVDFEKNKRYNKRLIENNWSKYEDDPALAQSVGEDDLPKTDDLNYLLEIASSDCAHFEFTSEKLWRNENNAVPASEIFNLDLDILSSALSCLPFHERMGLSESELSAEDKLKFKEEAERNWKEYSSVKEKLMKKFEDDPKIKDVVNNLKPLNKSMKDRLDLYVRSKDNEKTESSEAAELTKVESLTEVDFSDNESSDKIEKRKQNIFFSENDENLEDWLDSVLDD